MRKYNHTTKTNRINDDNSDKKINKWKTKNKREIKLYAATTGQIYIS